MIIIIMLSKTGLTIVVSCFELPLLVCNPLHVYVLQTENQKYASYLSRTYQCSQKMDKNVLHRHYTLKIFPYLEMSGNALLVFQNNTNGGLIVTYR